MVILTSILVACVVSIHAYSRIQQRRISSVQLWRGSWRKQVLNILPLPQILFAVHEEYESDLQIVSVEAATPSDGIHG